MNERFLHIDKMNNCVELKFKYDEKDQDQPLASKINLMNLLHIDFWLSH